MLSRFIPNPSRHVRRLLSLSPSPHLHPLPPPLLPSFSPSPRIPNLGFTHFAARHFSTGDNNGEKPTPVLWKIDPESENSGDIFRDNNGGDSTGTGGDGRIEKGFGEGDSGVDDWLAATGEFKPWDLNKDEKMVEEVFDVGGVVEKQTEVENVESVELDMEKKGQDDLQLQKEEESLLAVIKGPNRAFGDLVAISGITDAMLDSLIALKDFKDVGGLPPLSVIEDERYENSLKKSSRYEIELQKQEEIARSRVRQVDEKGRAYGTGRRKCSIARVWIEPGEGKFVVNEKDFDVYFPMLDHRAALLRPFSETKTLGLWDIKCTVKGGGVSGQVGAIQLGISRALQNWEPGLRPPLRDAGFLTRDPRVVERKKPGKAKARKSFQWVKR